MKNPTTQIYLPETGFKQLENGTRGVVFRISSELVAKILYRKKNGDYKLRDDDEGLDELTHESDITSRLYKADIGNVPKPMGIERIRVYGTAFNAFIMEYIDLKRGDELGQVNLGIVERLVKEEIFKAADIGLFPGDDYLNPANFFYDIEKKMVRLIDFGRWEIDS